MFSEHTRKTITNKVLEGRGWFLICSLVAMAAIITRFLFLADKPYHHDESLHAYYSHRVSEGHPHEYSALLHGPVLYYLVGAFMVVFGSDDFTARFPAAACNVLLVLLPLFWRRALGNGTALVISLFLLLSPTFMYYGRFLREDAFNSLWIGLSLAGFFGYHWWGKPWHAVAAAAFLSMQFCNKENAYLHVFVWLAGVAAIMWLMRRSGLNDLNALRGGYVPLSAWSDRIALIMNCVSVFVFIYVLFYSAFFRHSKGTLHGILDGLYRESLLYWWDQNQKRRIDGPFDYHFPLLLNYEFALIPALICAWIRGVSLSAKNMAFAVLRFPLTLLNNSRNVFIFSALLLGSIALPRIGLTPEGCGISEFCLTNMAGDNTNNVVSAVAKKLHIAHSRHLLQLLSIALLGAIAVLASARLRRFLDAFLWWWATGMLGIYSYVGEKVPWLLIYILMPLVALAGLEIGRLLAGTRNFFNRNPLTEAPLNSDVKKSVDEAEERFSNRAQRLILTLTLVFAVFGTWKAIKLSFFEPANPVERLVFTQTTPSMKSIRDRWSHLSKVSGRSPRVTMTGDSTWPMAWYAHNLQGADFVRPADASAAASFDALFLDVGELDFARKELQSFDIYKVPLRHWWVPQPNPRPHEILDYFLTSRPYPGELRESPLEQGIGDVSVLYLENRAPDRFFATAEPCACGERVEMARLPVGNPSNPSGQSPAAPAERKD
jgi:uncharacterized protein (TIGR03663 family)